MNQTEQLPEITLKAVLLGIILSIVLAGANAYLGLFAGMTVSASIPAAVISMGVLRLFKRSNILENNIVQTAASSGEALAAGVIFTIPALIIMGHWSSFSFKEHYWTITGIAILGGLLGTLFTIPLRRALIIEDPLQFPEGIATAEVLKSGHSDSQGVVNLIKGAIAGGLFKFLAEGLGLWTGILSGAKAVGRTFLSFQLNLSPALISVGYIVGINIAILVFAGGVIGRWIALPALALLYPHPPEAETAVTYLHNYYVKYIGVGAMIVGGIWTLFSLSSSVIKGIKSGLAVYKNIRLSGTTHVSRMDMDTPMPWVLAAIIFSVIPIFAIYLSAVQSPLISFVMTIVMVITGFIFSAVAAYMAGLVGSSNNPVSGVTIATILLSSFLLYFLSKFTDAVIGPASAIFIGAVVCCACALGGDNMQDLKTGYIVQSTPWKQQVMQVVGTVASALIIMPVLWLLHQRYGIGVPVREGVRPLEAPQANLMAHIAKGVFEQTLPWKLIFAGGILAGIIILWDKWLESQHSSFRTPILAVAVGLYLPFHLSVPIFIGGIVAYFSGGRILHSGSQPTSGLLFASGLITGEALMGILLAVPLLIQQLTPWKNFPTEFTIFPSTSLGPWPGVILLGGIIYWLRKVTK